MNKVHKKIWTFDTAKVIIFLGMNLNKDIYNATLERFWSYLEQKYWLLRGISKTNSPHFTTFQHFNLALINYCSQCLSIPPSKNQCPIKYVVRLLFTLVVSTKETINGVHFRSFYRSVNFKCPFGVTKRSNQKK